MDKVDGTQEQMGNVSRDGNPKNQKKKMLEIQKHHHWNRNEECPPFLGHAEQLAGP